MSNPNKANDTLERCMIYEFLKNHQSIIKRELKIANAETIAAPLEMKNYFLEKYNLLKGLDYLLNKYDQKP